MRQTLLVATTLLSVSTVGALGAQSLADRVARVDGQVQVVFPSHPELCGDGRGQIGNMFGRHGQFFGSYENGHRSICVEGPARVVATVSHGAVTRLRTYVGPVPDPSPDVTDLGSVSADDARAWLLSLLRAGSASAAKEAVVPLLVVNAPYPWADLLAAARNDRHPDAVRREATFWLGQGASAHIDSAGDGSDEDDVRRSAVFALSQQPKDAAVPLLIQIATGNTQPPVRASAMFWLGQSGDPRALDVFARVLDLPR
jgi:hypothetical protein